MNKGNSKCSNNQWNAVDRIATNRHIFEWVNVQNDDLTEIKFKEIILVLVIAKGIKICKPATPVYTHIIAECVNI